MTISKTTENYALKRNLDVTEMTISTGAMALWIWTEDNECEPALIYTESENGGWIFHGHFLEQSIKEELPHWIKNEKHLREVLDFISKSL